MYRYVCMYLVLVTLGDFDSECFHFFVFLSDNLLVFSSVLVQHCTQLTHLHERERGIGREREREREREGERESQGNIASCANMLCDRQVGINTKILLCKSIETCESKDILASSCSRLVVSASVLYLSTSEESSAVLRENRARISHNCRRREMEIKDCKGDGGREGQAVLREN